ncbi:serine hydrolase domain-containing protein [Phenylobacterium sp.]|uniref:serine hydrolase domain-containing protein n=1 Tax=Phenylobacterium sp. TaxID=1871053 RepID=UPI00356887DD
MDPGRVQAFLDDAQRLGVELNSFMAWRAGDVIAEGWWWPYRPDLRHMMHSATKSFLSAGIGLAIAEGRFDLDEQVISFFPDRLPRVVSPHLAAMTVEDLLTQTSGHARGASGSIWRGIATSWIDEFFKIPVVYPPGSKFKYTSASSFMLSAILSRTTGESALDYIAPRLLRPLGIDGLTWDIGPEGINPGGNGISCRTVDLLKLAILHMRKGTWNGEQVLPVSWVERATRPARGNAHGYHWWMGPGGAFYAYGLFGQFAVMFPEHDAVLALTAAVPPSEETLRSLVWRHFPVAFEEPRSAGTRAQDASVIASWTNLRLLPELKPQASAIAARVSGRLHAAEPNSDGIVSLQFDFASNRCAFHLQDGRGHHVINVGLLNWLESETTMSGGALHHGYEPPRMRVMAGGRWLDAETFEMTWQFVETSFRDRVVTKFEADSLVFARSVNINSGELVRPPIVAHSLGLR